MEAESTAQPAPTRASSPHQSGITWRPFEHHPGLLDVDNSAPANEGLYPADYSSLAFERPVNVVNAITHNSLEMALLTLFIPRRLSGPFAYEGLRLTGSSPGGPYDPKDSKFSATPSELRDLFAFSTRWVEGYLAAKSGESGPSGVRAGSAILSSLNAQQKRGSVVFARLKKMILTRSFAKRIEARMTETETFPIGSEDPRGATSIMGDFVYHPDTIMDILGPQAIWYNEMGDPKVSAIVRSAAEGFFIHHFKNAKLRLVRRAKKVNDEHDEAAKAHKGKIHQSLHLSNTISLGFSEWLTDPTPENTRNFFNVVKGLELIVEKVIKANQEADSKAEKWRSSLAVFKSELRDIAEDVIAENTKRKQARGVTTGMPLLSISITTG
jgi:hypothetical protein